ncbi:MAG: hypothetical protein AUJ34_02830 [Parcubacteria group bacterium CG1_02_41_12]|nr:MAG: hypothetical protein AUJ34_02830 [Parcubacteria group bacterium CG1_02_41_12]PIQ79957.1 MAG: hypothetical protein COV79_02765 [Parcubacteria group bacterium CG11_big_fil_rev_8_21_14_0_20_41_14]PIZ80766.1 MAG: hypothetical protein COY02_03480 [Parcubacteria group bacterium CG_4_10_14_0_2_um_filter_41_6]
MESIVKENLELTKQVLEYVKKTRRYILFGQILNVIKIVLIIGPIVLAIIYLPPILRQFLSTYSDLLDGGTGSTILQGGGFVDKLFEAKQ